MTEHRGLRGKEKNIVLIGFMGSGKSSVGKKLSYKLKEPFIDSDSLIEKRAGCSITQIFADKGEYAFRDIETKCIRELTEKKPGFIISTGGGMPLREENRKLLRKIGSVVYLKAEPETIYERIKDDTSRPLLRSEDPQKKIREMMNERSSIYEEAADITVITDGKSCREIADEIAAAVGIEPITKRQAINKAASKAPVKVSITL